MTDGNTHAINKHLQEREDYEASLPVTMYCGACDEEISSESWPSFIAEGACPNCEGELVDDASEYEPTEADQGLIPIPEGYAEQ